MRLIAVSLLFASGAANAFSLSCQLGADCVASQGTKIPVKKVIELLDDCDDFTRGDIGRTVMRLSTKELLDRTQGQVNNLALAWHAHDKIHDSPLRYHRPRRMEETKYDDIKRACRDLARDLERHD